MSIADPNGKILLLGTCGMGMLPLAIYLNEHGYTLYVSDDFPQPYAQPYLQKKGICWVSPHNCPDDFDLIVYSQAIPFSHPLRQKGRSRNIPELSRGHFLAQCLEGKKLVAIVGSHGKTTTTSLLIHTLQQAPHFKFSYLLGALFRDKRLAPAHYEARSEWVIAEIDESDGSIEAFSPEITLALNLDWDHHSHYPTEALLQKTFRHLFERTKKALFIPEHSKVLLQLSNTSSALLRPFGNKNQIQLPTQSGSDNNSVKNDWILHIESNPIDSLKKDGAHKLSKRENNSALFSLGQTIKVPLVGDFNVSNALASLCVCQYILGTLPQEPFKNYQGVHRRQDQLFESHSLSVLADYAHHPTEIEALLRAYPRTSWKRVIIFQPHRYTRTAHYAQKFAEVLSEADQVILLPVYAASENPLEKGSSEQILAQIPKATSACIMKKEDPLILQKIASYCEDQPTYCFFIGAGDINQLAVQFTDYLNLKEVKPIIDISSKLSHACPIKQYEPLGSKTTLKVGGQARYFAQPSNAIELSSLIKEAQVLKIPYFILGRGSNLIVSDDLYEGLIIQLNQAQWQTIELIGERQIWIGAGVRLKELCGKAASLGISGFEFLEGIPGCVGGALRMNAGAMGHEIFDLVEQIEILDDRGDFQSLSKEECIISYRNCETLKHKVALRALFKGTSIQAKEVIQNTMAVFSKKRKATQPRDPSAGCMFKNPKGDHAGRLIEAAGLKGFSIGGAKVSPIHANFVINTGNATAKEVQELIRSVQKTVKTIHNIELEPEALYIES